MPSVFESLAPGIRPILSFEDLLVRFRLGDRMDIRLVGSEFLLINPQEPGEL
jgi:hypothetical protein